MIPSADIIFKLAAKVLKKCALIAFLCIKFWIKTDFLFLSQFKAAK